MADRPTADVTDVLLDSMDRMLEQLVERLAGLTDEEYLWEPVAGAWSVRHHASGEVLVDGAGVRDIDPAPVTTIAWRLWHLALDCFDDYTRRFHGDIAEASPEWTLHAHTAVALLEQHWGRYRAEIAGRDALEPLGENWGPWSHHCVADMAMHASNELVHHGAEIALLRDLYRATTGARLDG